MGRLNRSRQMGQTSSSSDSVLAIVSISGNTSKDKSRMCYMEQLERSQVLLTALLAHIETVVPGKPSMSTNSHVCGVALHLADYSSCFKFNKELSQILDIKSNKT